MVALSNYVMFNVICSSSDTAFKGYYFHKKCTGNIIATELKTVCSETVKSDVVGKQKDFGLAQTFFRFFCYVFLGQSFILVAIELFIALN